MPNTKESGIQRLTSQTATACKPGRMEPATRAAGKMASRTVKERSSSPTVMSITATGAMTWWMDSACTLTSTEESTKVNGFRTNKLILELTHGQTVLSTQANSKTAWSTAVASSSGPTRAVTKANSKTTISTEKGNISGLMANNIKGRG